MGVRRSWLIPVAEVVAMVVLIEFVLVAVALLVVLLEFLVGLRRRSPLVGSAVLGHVADQEADLLPSVVRSPVRMGSLYEETEIRARSNRTERQSLPGSS